LPRPKASYPDPEQKLRPYHGVKNNPQCSRGIPSSTPAQLLRILFLSWFSAHLHNQIDFDAQQVTKVISMRMTSKRLMEPEKMNQEIQITSLALLDAQMRAKMPSSSTPLLFLATEALLTEDLFYFSKRGHNQRHHSSMRSGATKLKSLRRTLRYPPRYRTVCRADVWVVG